MHEVLKLTEGGGVGELIERCCSVEDGMGDCGLHYGMLSVDVYQFECEAGGVLFDPNNNTLQ